MRTTHNSNLPSNTFVRRLCIACYFSLTTAVTLVTSGCSGNDSKTTVDTNVLSEQAKLQKTRLTETLDTFMLDPTLVNGLITVNNGTPQGSFSVSQGLADPAANIEMTDKHQFHIASMTKPFTTVLLLQLIEEGYFTLDSTLAEVLGKATIAELFPGYSFTASNQEGTLVSSMTINDLQQYQGNAQGDNITIRMLTQHSHGMPDLTFDNFPGTASLAEYTILSSIGVIENDPSLPAQWSGPALLEFYLASELPMLSLFASGSDYHYGDTGPVVAGLIIERETGMTLAQAYRNRIFDRLAKNDTYYEEPVQSDSTGIAHRHFDLTGAAPAVANVDVDAENWNTSIDWAGGGLVSTAADLDKFYRGLFGGQLLNNSDILKDPRYWIDANDEFQLYGLGTGVRSGADTSTVKAYDQGGFWGSYMAFYPESQTSVVMTINQVEFDEFDTLLETLEELFF